MKRCWRCKTEKSKSEFGKNRSCKDGLCAVCKTCSSEMQKISRAANPERYRETGKRYRDANKDRLKAAYAEWYSQNKAYFSKWREENMQSVKAAALKYRVTHAKDLQEKRKAWREKNPNYSRAYCKRHPEKARTILANRRARMRAAGGSHTADDIHLLMKLQKGKCAVCRCGIRSRYHVDHVIPVVLGGSNDRLNLQLLCPTCNREKHAKHPVDFMQTKGFLL